MRRSLSRAACVVACLAAFSRPCLRSSSRRRRRPLRHASTLRTRVPFDRAIHTSDAAEWPEVLRPAERPAREARLAAAGGQGRLDGRGRRPAGARALHRAHGVQRQRAFQARRAGLDVRIDRRAARTARQRLHELRRDGVHARPAERPGGHRREWTDGARGFCRRPHARSRRGREGTRRRHRGRVARRPRRRIADPRQADSDPLLPVALRRPAADRQTGDHPHGAGGAAARLLRHLVSPGTHGGRRRRRHRHAADRERDQDALRTDPATRQGRAGARQHASRSSSSTSSASSPIRRSRSRACRSSASARRRRKGASPTTGAIWSSG